MRRGRKKTSGRGLTWTKDALTLSLTRWDNDTLSVAVVNKDRSLAFEVDGFTLAADDRAELVELFAASDAELWEAS